MKEVIVGDIRDENVISSLAKKSFDVVIHLVSLDHHKSEDNPNYVSSINVLPTWNLLNSFTKTGLDKFIYFSTIHVYGKLPRETINEDYPSNPINAYGLTHLLSENICNYYNNKTNTECINVRLSNSYGSPVFKENNCWWLVINNLCKTAFKEKNIKLICYVSIAYNYISDFNIVNLVNNSDKIIVASNFIKNNLELLMVKCLQEQIPNLDIPISVVPYGICRKNFHIIDKIDAISMT